jgi:hypothetical protein
MLAMTYHNMIPDPGFVAMPESSDRDFRRGILAGEMPEVDPPTYRLRAAYEQLPAYPFSAGAGLMSAQLRAILEAEAGPADCLSWIDCAVVCGETSFVYAVPVDLAPPPLFDLAQTDFGPSGIPMRWALQSVGLEGRHVVKVPKLHSGLVVTQRIREAVVDAGLVGVEWLTAHVT